MSVTASQTSHRRRTTAISSAVLAVIALVITGFAVNYPGLSPSEVEVSNGGVWVMNQKDSLVGRVNVDAAELDARLTAAGDDLELLQDGYTVLLTGARGITPVNTASVQRDPLVELAPGSTVRLGHDRVAIASEDGKVWILSPGQLPGFSPATVEPDYATGGSPAEIVVGSDGTVFVLDGTTLRTFPYAADPGRTAQAEPIEVDGLSTAADQVQLTAVGEEPVILDKENSVLRLGTSATEYDLMADGVGSLDSAQLQQAGPAADDVALATESTLLRVPLDGGRARTTEAGAPGTPVPPAQIGGCVYGAWTKSNLYARVCDGLDPVVAPVPGADSAADLTLRVNQDLVVLNDQQFGLSWKITENMEPVDDWAVKQKLEMDETTEEDEETLTTSITNIAAEREKENRPPTATPDEFGVRPGKSIVLPVTRNDTDPDGDVLTAEVSGKQPAVGTVTPIRGGTQLQIDVDEDATGTADFTYEVDDGRGGTATATVTLDVREAGESSGPQAAKGAVTKVQVSSGQDISVNVLPYWEDPDGDAFYLTGATTEGEDVVSVQADGLVTFHDAGLTTGVKTVQLTFRDEQGTVGEGTLEVEAISDRDLPPITTGDHAGAVTGRTTTVKPLVNDLNPQGGELELINVSEVEELEVDPVLEAGTINITGSTPGTYYLEYTTAASGASASSLGIIRVDIAEESSEELVPVAVDDTGTVTTGTDTLIDPLENDVDPTGGVLVTNSVRVPEGSGLKATVVGHHLIRVEAEPGAAVAEEPVPLTYEVANSAGSTEGTVRVMLASTDTQFANPVAVADRAVVRAGDMVSIPVVANDVSPTDSEMHLDRILDPDGAEAAGHAETHQDEVRFHADADANGDVVVTYVVVDETGRSGSARVTITIVPRDAPNTPPRPENLTARTVAGTPVRIPVPTTGTDPDGDSVILTGITSPTPLLGEVKSAYGGWIEYTPYAGSSGTDRFRYQVMDRNGAIGTGEVLVGIAPPSAQNQPPYAADDTVAVRPDREVQIPVLENDTDPEGATLSVVREDVEATTAIEVAAPEDETIDGVVTVRTPSEPGTHTVLYGASDGVLTGRASVTIKVDPEAPKRAPVANDDYVAPAAVMEPGVEHIDVDVLGNDRDPDGSASDLDVTLEGSAPGAEVLKDGSVRVTPTEDLQHLRYVIEDVDGQESAGYIWVPGTAKQAPIWVGEPLRVQAGSETTVDLSDPTNVRVRPGAQPATITDASTATASHTDGSPLVQDSSTLAYRAADDYSGKDTLSVEVTDGEVGDSSAATATLAIPVEVAAKGTNLPPTLQGARLETEQGGTSETIDLQGLSEDPDDTELDYALGEFPAVDGVEVTLDGSALVASAEATVPKGSTVEVPVTVSDGTNPPVTATISVSVVGSRKPLLTALRDVVEIDAGSTKSVAVLENDSNPFPGGKRTVESASKVTGDGVVSREGDQVVITPDADYHGILTAQYSVMDDTGDPERIATGEIRVDVRGKPAAPSAPRIGTVGNGSVELNFTAGNDYGAPITGYTVTSASGPEHTQECPATSCTITDLANGTDYTFEVTATNEIGTSVPSAASATARPDVRPEQPSAPTADRGDRQLTVSWTPPVNKGSAIQSYQLQMEDSTTGQVQDREAEPGATQLAWTGLTNGSDYRFRVRAHNLADDPSDWSGWSKAEHPAGKPAAPSGRPTAERINDPLGGGITVTWPAMSDQEANGEDITTYRVTASSGATQDVKGSSTSTTFSNLDPDIEHTFTYTAVNSVGASDGTSPTSNAVVPWARPDAPAGVKATLPDAGSGDGPNGRATVSWDAADGHGSTVTEYVVRWGGGSQVVKEGTSATIDGLTNGKAYTFTVQAKNRYDGGDSVISDPSNSVTPYTRPTKPQTSSSSATCVDATNCPVTLTAKAPGGDGGGGGKTLQVSIDGGSWTNAGGTSYTTTLEAKSGATHTIKARAANAKGLVSDTVQASQKAEIYTPPKPAADASWGPKGATRGGVCESQNCRRVNIELSNLDPAKTYTLTMYTESTAAQAGGEWKPPVEVHPRADGTWTTQRDSEYDFLYGYPDNPFVIRLDGTDISKETYP